MVETKIVKETSTHYGIGISGATILGFFLFLSALAISGNVALAVSFFITFLWILLILGVIAIVAIVIIVIIAILVA